MDNIDNVGEVVPTLVISHFLEGVRRGWSPGLCIPPSPSNFFGPPAQENGVKYQGFPALGVVIQGILNPLLRQSLGMQVRTSYGTLEQKR
jgi:hypothetical protein